jgi:hypothetical protein
MSELNNRLALLPSDYQKFLKSGFIESVAESATETYQLSSEQLNALTASLYLFLLFEMGTREFVESLMKDVGLSHDDTRAVSSTLFDALPENFPWELANKTGIDIEISDLENTISRLENIRTMSNDMEAHSANEQTHTSSQDAILGDNVPRWDSENS